MIEVLVLIIYGAGAGLSAYLQGLWGWNRHICESPEWAICVLIWPVTIVFALLAKLTSVGREHRKKFRDE